MEADRCRRHSEPRVQVRNCSAHVRGPASIARRAGLCSGDGEWDFAPPILAKFRWPMIGQKVRTMSQGLRSMADPGGLDWTSRKTPFSHANDSGRDRFLAGQPPCH